jgi:hypothetical protein
MPQELDKPYFGGLGLLGMSNNPIKQLGTGAPGSQFVNNLASQAKNMDSQQLLHLISSLEKNGGYIGGSKFNMVAHEILKQELESRRPQVQGLGLLGAR